jgi:hypothetical protein
MEPKRVENLHTEGTHEGILRAHTRENRGLWNRRGEGEGKHHTAAGLGDD